jgi:CDP-paratose 2-epimerase
MAVVIVTGAAGLVGTATSYCFADKGLDVVGVDNDMRRQFFGPSASTVANRLRLEKDLTSYQHVDADIRDMATLEPLFQRYGKDIAAVVHTAAQPSHDWSAGDPHTDFTINSLGTLNLLECTRRSAPDAVFIFTSTNKVYGDKPNFLPLVEQDARWELDAEHRYAGGIDESLGLDETMHSLFGVSKCAADLLVQEYGRLFGIRTACFRAGCVTGPRHAGAQLHGFLAYLTQCAVAGRPYTVFGYKGKQVRDNIHASDMANAFWSFFAAPRVAEVYNIGGGRTSNCSIIEAIQIIEQSTGRPMTWHYDDNARAGDHIWWISDNSKFQSHFPTWALTYDGPRLIEELVDSLETSLAQ